MSFEFRLRPLGRLLAISITVCSIGNPASARTQLDASRHKEASARREATNEPAGPYFVEFMARPTEAFGHSFVSLGMVGKFHQDKTTKTLGFYPVDKTGTAVFNSPGVITNRKLDRASQSTVKYRVLVSKTSYLKAMRATQLMKKSWVRYDLISHNCNHMIGQTARGLGLKDPGDYADTPENYVRALKAQNGGRERGSWLRSAGTFSVNKV
jgi:hypothetical protein